MSTLLVLGGARSGKSRYAELRAAAWDLKPIYVATAQALDDEMLSRIARHRAERGPGWNTVEVPLELAGTVASLSAPETIVLIDCLTLWTSNLILARRDCDEACAELVRAIEAAQGPIILVANEVGLGIVPDNALARRFRDEAGRINQRVAAAVDEVQFVAAGLPLCLK
jgi:adenosylcobinamide kinase/adenosylcobinamide-phosphate guanylyltransferase